MSINCELNGTFKAPADEGVKRHKLVAGASFPEVARTTLPNDKKNYPSTNQAQYCFQKYNEYRLCLRNNGGNASTSCQDLYAQASVICPNKWLSDWAEQAEQGRYPGIQITPVPKPSHDHH